MFQFDTVCPANRVACDNGYRLCSLAACLPPLLVPTGWSFHADLGADLQDAGKLTAEDVVQGIHCMSPACIRASLLQSLERMRLMTVDLLYLHNPTEMQLGHLGKGNFTVKLKESFKEMEKLRKEGLIKGYGLATWDCFRVPPTSPQVSEHQLRQWDCSSIINWHYYSRFCYMAVACRLHLCLCRPLTCILITLTQ